MGTGRSVVGLGVLLAMAACGGTDTDGSGVASPHESTGLRPRARIDAVDDGRAGATCDATRVLVHLTTGATCGAIARAMANLVPGVRAASQFATAPREVRESFCAISSATGGAEAVARLLPILASIPTVAFAVPECSTNPLVTSSEDPSALVAPRGSLAPRSPSEHLAAQAIDTLLRDDGGAMVSAQGTHSCDACAVAVDDTLFVDLPPDMTATTDTRMLVQFADPSQPVQQIVAPAGAQSFTVPGLDVPNSASILITATGETASP